MRLTDRSVTSTNPPTPAKGEVVIFDEDTPGFGLRLRATGGRSWVYVYWHGGRARRVTLGSWPKLSAKLARDMVGPLARQVGEGKDPQDAKLEARSRKETFREAVDLYLSIKARQLRPRSMVEVERHLRVHAKPLHGIALEILNLKDVAGLLADISANNGPVASNRVRASISAMLEWAIGAGKATTNVASFSNKEVERSRSRFLSDEELFDIWHALPEGGYGDIVKLLILTGQRREEIGGLCWSEINLADNQIILPGYRTKNGRQHVIPLSRQAHKIIDATPRTEGRDFVFGYGVTGFSGWGKSKERLDAKLPNMKPWRLHDIRHTVATGMATNGVQPHIVEAVLNHVSGHKSGVAGLYNHATYEKEKIEAMDRWNDAVSYKTMLRGSGRKRKKVGIRPDTPEMVR